MSLRVMPAYRVTSPATGRRPDPFVFIDTVRDVLLPTYRRRFTALLAEHATAIVDHHRHTDGQRPLALHADVTNLDRPVWAVWRSIDKTTREARLNGRRLSLDLEAEVSLVLDPDDRDGAMYARLHTTQAVYATAFASIDGVEDFSCDTSIDSHEAMTQEENLRRAAVWSRIEERPGPVIPHRLAWTMLGNDVTLTPRDVEDDLMGHLPTAAARAWHLATALARVRYEQEVRPTPESFDLADFAEKVTDFRAEMLPHAASLLQPITHEDLLGRTPARGGL